MCLTPSYNCQHVTAQRTETPTKTLWIKTTRTNSNDKARAGQISV